MARLARQAVREVDRQAIEEFGVPGVVLMENAGSNAARLLAGLGITGPIAIACGRGNNGGDGLVMARHLDAAGHEVRLLLAAPAAAYAGDAAVNLRICDRSGLTIDHLADADEPAWRHALAGTAGSPMPCWARGPWGRLAAAWRRPSRPSTPCGLQREPPRCGCSPSTCPRASMPIRAWRRATVFGPT